MDTTAYLTRHGWLGDGHSLHPSGNGIKTPLLVSKKTNVLGIGKKQHDAQADQWWARAFDATLKDLNVGVDDATGKVKRVTFGAGAKQLQTVGRIGAKWAASGGLYGAFIRGQSLEGTITPESAKEKKQDEGDNASKRGKRTKNEREERRRTRETRKERKRRQKDEATTNNGLRVLGIPLKVSSTLAVVHPGSPGEHQQERGKEMERRSKTTDKAAKKLLKEARHKVQEEREMKVTGDPESTIGSAEHVAVKPLKSKKKYAASATR